MGPIILAGSLVILGPHFCMDRTLIDTSLREKYEELPQEPIRIDDKMVIQFYRGPHSWSLLMIEPDGRTCIVNAGQGWDLNKS